MSAGPVSEFLRNAGGPFRRLAVYIAIGLEEEDARRAIERERDPVALAGLKEHREALRRLREHAIAVLTCAAHARGDLTIPARPAPRKGDPDASV